jgi:Fe-S-cluster containining protein
MGRSPDPLRRVPSFPFVAYDRLEAIYRELEEAIAKTRPRCDLTGRCCDFESSGHTLFATELEARYLLARASGPPSTLLAGTGPLVPPPNRLCPFWKNRLCTAREGRPLGCRVYFCDSSYRDLMPELYERFQARIRALHDELGLPYRYAPLVETLREIHAVEGRGRGVDAPEGL